MTELLAGINGVICYFGEILCHTTKPEKHEQLLVQVTERLKEVGLQLNEGNNVSTGSPRSTFWDTSSVDRASDPTQQRSRRS